MHRLAAALVATLAITVATAPATTADTPPKPRVSAENYQGPYPSKVCRYVLQIRLHHHPIIRFVRVCHRRVY